MKFLTLSYFYWLIVACAKRGQKVPQGFYNMGLMLKSIIRNGEVLAFGTCMDARGLTDDDILEGVAPDIMSVLSEHTLNADKVPVF